MEIFHTIVAARIVFITAVANLILGFILFATCRWIPIARLTRGLMKTGFFKRFFACHTYLWWVFWVSVITHAVFAIGRAGFPFK